MVRSMFAAVAGLRAHQTKMDVIGNNIANVNTYSYKKMRATFSEQFYATLSGGSNANETRGGTNPTQIGYGSQIGTIDVNTGTGSIAATDRGLDVMIAGGGYFMVGDYNKDGYDTTSNTDGNNLTSLDLTRVGIFGFDGAGNMVDVNGSHVYGFQNKDVYAKDGLWGVPKDPALPNDPDRIPKLEALQMPKCVMDASGKAIVVDVKITTGTPPVTETIKRYAVPYTNAAGNMVYKDSTDAEVVIGAAGTGDAQKYYAAPMKLDSVSIGDDGTVSGLNELKQIIVVGKVAIANVPNPNALEATNNSYYKAKDNTGIVTAEIPGQGATGPLQAGKLEMSNVDLSLEMTDMITTQRGFQANSRIITVTDAMLEELVNLKR